MSANITEQIIPFAIALAIGAGISSSIAAPATSNGSALPNVQWTSDLPLADPVVTADSLIAALVSRLFGAQMVD